MKKYFGLILLVLGFGIFGGVIYVNSVYSQQIRTFSPYTLLTSSWENYKIRFINQDGRVIDYSQNGITTSEGQSYAMLQAVWMDDKATFDRVWMWTKNDLKRPSDNLFGWRWGQIGGNGYGLLPDGGANSASDADSDIALALVLAGRRWEQSDYINQAKPIINDIWNIETDIINGNRYLVAGNWAIGNDKSVINPSYFAPYAWRIFSKIDTDPSHNWDSLINPAYQLLNQVTQDKFNQSVTAGLPPDWVALTKPDGKIQETNLPGLTTNYTFNAMRVPWRIAVDSIWNKEPQAEAYLRTLHFLTDQYQSTKQLMNGYTHVGEPLGQSQDPAMYGTALGYFMVVDPGTAKDIYQNKIISLYSNDTNSFQNDLPYYETNWLWFGSALYLHYIVPY